MPPNPNEWVGNDRPWNDIRDVSEFQGQGKPIAHTLYPIIPHSAIIEATGFIRTATGEIELIAQPASGNTGVGHVPVTCANAKP
ncbi:hypothetical protein [Nostoc sp.]|uniref:hypothetical protein n=1 Tax=Nostoc sp. TaxID=1180 RepID=UPI002FF597D5